MTYIRKMKIFLTLPLLALFAILGCASKPQTSCQELDWFELGRQDGSAAKERRPIKVVCTDSDESLNEALYNNGFDSTISDHCTHESGYALGLAGKPIFSYCPPLLEEEYSQAYEQGVKVMELKKEKTALDQRLLSLEKQLKDKSIDIVRRELMSNEKITLLEKKKQLEAELKNSSNISQN